jgi:phosphomannomutase
MLRSIADAEGFKFEETLTGFKWMGNRADELRKAGKTVIFSFEEAIGFCCGDVIKDKVMPAHPFSKDIIEASRFLQCMTSVRCSSPALRKPACVGLLTVVVL